jgi:hypothetical protein
MDGDDICYPTRFEKQIEFLNNNPEVDILGTAAHIIDREGRKNGHLKWPSKNDNIKKAVWCNPMIHPSVIFRLDKINAIGGYPEHPRRQDYALWFRAVKAGLVFHNLPDFLIQYRIIKRHYKKTKLADTLLQTRIGWMGYASIGGINPLHYAMMAWPIARSILPSKWQQKLQKNFRKYDPRRRIIRDSKGQGQNGHI